MKCLDKRRIKSRHGEDLVFNERNILTQVSGRGCTGEQLRMYSMNKWTCGGSVSYRCS